ncbi:hypothetical protein Syun_016470 [Stephania yunnanensis]|uniref:Uncharacterized protein n=1 Tax=Stephania yunnanensis TaxID=152371 RepID=A0AAP0P278_9MAGN
MLGDKVKRKRGSEKPINFSYNKWAHLAVPMLISAGDDTKLFAYSAQKFTMKILKVFIYFYEDFESIHLLLK